MRRPSLSELGIVVLSRKLYPTLLGLKSLKDNGVIPAELEPTGDVVLSDQVALIKFEGLSINALIQSPEQYNLSVVSEDLTGKADNAGAAPEFVQKLLKAHESLGCTALGVNPVCSLPFDSREEVYRFAKRLLLKDGAWDSFRDKNCLLRSVQIAYDLGGGSWFNLTLRSPQAKEDPNSLFVHGNFHHSIEPKDDTEATEKALEFLDTWNELVGEFTAFVERMVDTEQ